MAYLDPPYNQHRYFTNYHVWETLVAWDAPEAYGVARKRLDARDPSTRSAFNSKRTMPAALASVVQSVDCDLLVLSYNNESWLGLEELEAMCRPHRPHRPHRRGRTRRSENGVATLAFDSARYVGARIGIFDPSGRKVGRVSHLSNQELLVIAGEPTLVRRVVEAAEAGSTSATGPASAAALSPHLSPHPPPHPAPHPSLRRWLHRSGRRRAGGSTTTGNVSKHDHGGHDDDHHDGSSHATASQTSTRNTNSSHTNSSDDTAGSTNLDGSSDMNPDRCPTAMAVSSVGGLRPLAEALQGRGSQASR